MGKTTGADVGKRKKVQLNNAWLKSAWPQPNEPAAISFLRQDFKALKRAKTGKSEGDLRNALADVDVSLDKLHRESEKLLKNHPFKKKAIQKDLQYARSLVQKEFRVLAKVGGSMRVVYNKDFGAAMTEELKKFKIDVGERRVKLSLLEALAVELDEKNALNMLNNMLNDRFDAAVKKCTKTIHGLLRKSGGLMNELTRDGVAGYIGDAASQLEAEMRDVPVAVFRKMRIHADVARKYKKDKAVKITKGAVGVGLGIAGSCLPGTLPLALVALVRSAASLAKEIATVLIDLETKIKHFLSYIKTLAKVYKKHRGAREITMSTINSVLGVDVMPTLAKAKADIKEIEKCVAVFYHRATKLNEKIKDALDKSNELNRKLVKSACDAKSFAKSKLARKTKAATTKLTTLLDKGHDLMRQATTADKQMPFLRKKLKDLGENPGSVDKANVIIGQLINCGIAVAGITDAATVAQAIESMAVAGVGTMLDAADVGKELASL